MLKEFLEEKTNEGYVFNIHYDHNLFMLFIYVTSKDGKNAVNSEFDGSFLHDEEKFVSALQKIVDKLEGKENG